MILVSDSYTGSSVSLVNVSGQNDNGIIVWPSRIDWSRLVKISIN